MSQLFATKSIEDLQKEAASATEGASAGGATTLHRVLGPVGLTSIGVGAVIGAGIFVMTGRAAAQYAGPAVMLSYVLAGVTCVFAALCYAEFAAMAPAAGSAYSYSYATLGELFAWLMGWDLILEYAMACATVASAWSEYVNELIFVLSGTRIPAYLCNDPFSTRGAWFNAPAVFITVALTYVLVIGIKESVTTNTILVFTKVGVVLLVIVVGFTFVNPANWTTIPESDRILPEELLIPDLAVEYAATKENLPEEQAKERGKPLSVQALAVYKIERTPVINAELLAKGRITPAQAQARLDKITAEYGPKQPQAPADQAATADILKTVRAEAPKRAASSWGLLGLLGVNRLFGGIDDDTRSPFVPYGLSGIIFGAAIVFFAYIGFDAVSTHAEEAVQPQRNVPIGILASLLICTVLYIGVAAVITGMQEYPNIDPKAAVASAFTQKGMRFVPALIAIGGLAGMTSVLLISFQSQTRIFLAMARDGLLPKSIFARLHPRFRTPYVSTIAVGVGIAFVSAFTPIERLEQMVNIGTLLAFLTVCAAVMILRVRRPEVHRPFRAPLLFVVAPLGILINLVLMLFLKPFTWACLGIWLAIGLVIYFSFGFHHSVLGRRLAGREE